MKTTSPILACFLILVSCLRAELRLPTIIGDHIVLQQKHANPIWGWDTPETAKKFSAILLTSAYGLEPSLQITANWMVQVERLRDSHQATAKR